jgi:hypothetical protein
MLELQHQFAIKMKRGRHRIAEKALQKSPTQKNSKKAQSEPVPSQTGSKKTGRQKGSTKIKQRNETNSTIGSESEKPEARKSKRIAKKTA